MISHLVCRVLGHSINRRKVRFDGVYFCTACRRCGEELVREPNGWELRKDIDTDQREAS